MPKLAKYLPKSGQRWLSDAEGELGLGTVTSIEDRRLQIEFRATGISRIYAAQNAPLTRVAFEPGEKIASQTHQDLLVITVIDDAGLLTYQCEALSGEQVMVPEQELDDHLQLNRPQEKLFTARLDSDIWFGLRYQGLHQQAQESRSPVYGLRGARIGLIPHQLYIAAEVASRHSPRVLLADEVGLGKTIEAGLILHKLILDGQVNRVLLLVPDALMHQWLVEMLRRFNLRFALYDEQRMLASDSDNPFHDEQLVLCSLDLLVSSPQVAKHALNGEWDLLVVDEAHHLHWSEHETGIDYDLVDAISQQVQGILLLTATPEQLGRAGHFGRLRLLDPHRFPDYAAFLAEEDSYAAVAGIASKLIADTSLNDDEQQLLQQLLGDGASGGKEEVLAALVDRHGTGRVLFRNRRQGMSGFPGRELNVSLLEMPPQYAALDIEPAQQLTPEHYFGNGWVQIDRRVAWLINVLQELAGEKIVLICAHAQTVVDLRDHLLSKHAIHAAMFHEGMEIVERDRAAAFFADPEEGTPLLLCSEIGSEGRNFQFARHLVLFDLPLMPDLLEQRIGRLDRIGQRHQVQIHVPVFRGGASEFMYRWYNESIDAFEITSQTGSAVFEVVADKLIAAMCDPQAREEVLRFSREQNQRLIVEVEAGRDKLLELHSHRTSVSDHLIAQINTRSDQQWVEDYIYRYWNAFGVENEPGPGKSTVLHPGEHMHMESFPALPESGATVTFDREDALAHEDREFITIEHPMVRGAMDYLHSSDLGTTALTAIQHDDFGSGSLLLEILYVVDCPAPAELNIKRFLPAFDLRLLLDVHGNDIAANYAHEVLAGACLSRKPKIATAVLNRHGDVIRKLLTQGEGLADRQMSARVANAKQTMQSTLTLEYQRLVALAAVSANVREDERAYLQALPELLAGYLDKATTRLNAIRVIVVA